MIAFVHGTVCRWQETADALEHAIGSARARRRRSPGRAPLGVVRDGARRGPDARARGDRARRGGARPRARRAARPRRSRCSRSSPLHAMSGDFDRARELSARGAELLRDLGATVLAARTSDFSSRIELMAGEPAGGGGEAPGRLRRPDRDGRAVLPAEHRGAAREDALRARPARRGRGARRRRRRALASPEDVEAQALLQTVQARLLAARGRRRRRRHELALASRADRADRRAGPARRRALRRLVACSATQRDERRAALEEARSLYEQKQHLVGLARVEAELAKLAGVSSELRC